MSRKIYKHLETKVVTYEDVKKEKPTRVEVLTPKEYKNRKQ